MKDRVHPDLRRHSRFEVLETAVVYRNGASMPTAALIVDISLGGLQTRGRDAFELGESCIVVVGRDGDAPLPVPARVIFSMPIQETGLMATGFRFTPKTMEERMAIVQHVHDIFQKQGERLIG
jgi:hypothetical protein